MYKRQTNEPDLPCFLLYPMSVYTDDGDVTSVLELLINVKKQFEREFKTKKTSKNFEAITNKPLPPR